VTVTLDYNGGNVIVSLPSLVLTIGQPIAGLPVATRDLNWFQGWFTDPKAGTKMSNGDILNATGDFTLYAQWISGTRYTFNANGGTAVGTVKDVAAGAELGTMPTSSRAYYVRTGWFTKPVGGTKIIGTSLAPKTFGTRVLYAQWAKARHYVFNANGGTTTGTYKDVKKGGKVNALPTATRSNYYFAGWYTKKSGGTRVTSTTIAPKTAGTTVLYARWAAKVTYIFDPNGGKVSTTEKNVKGGSAIGALPSSSRGGYQFMGWYTAKKHGGTRVTSTYKVGNTPRTVTIYARWAPRSIYQSDSRWRNLPYSIGSMAGNGCGPTAMSIVVSTLMNDSSITAWTAAQWSTKHHYTQSAPGRTQPAFFIDWPKTYGITVTRIPGGSSATADAKALAAVKAGDWVVAFMRPGRWAYHGHYIVWYNYAGGTAYIKDPVGNRADRISGPIKLLQQQAWTYYIVHVPNNKKLWSV